MTIDGAVDPSDHTGKPLWCVYGTPATVSILHCKLEWSYSYRTSDPEDMELLIWGYDRYKPHRRDSYTSIGSDYYDWRKDHLDEGCDIEVWFIDKVQAVAYLNSLITPQ